MDQGGIAVLFAVLILVVWLFAILVLTERKSGYIISLIASLLNSLIPLGHLTGMAGEATPGEILTSSGPFFVWVVIALALTVFPSLILSAYLLFKPSTEKSAAPFKAVVNKCARSESHTILEKENIKCQLNKTKL